MANPQNLLQTKLMYPENWVLTGPLENDEGTSVVLESPDGMFFAMNRYTDRSDLEHVLLQAIDAMKAEYEEAEVEDYEADDAMLEELGRELQFYCKNLIVTSRLIVLRESEDVLLLQMQAENRDFDENELIFQAMVKSIRDGIRDNDQE